MGWACDRYQREGCLCAQAITMAEAVPQQSMVDLFKQESAAIATTKTTESNVFRDLDRRELTDEENKIIQQRVALQRKMLEEYQKREEKRKASTLSAERFCQSGFS